MKMTRMISALVAVAMASAVYAADAPDAVVKAVEAAMKAHHVPGVAIAKIENDQVAWVRGFGVADGKTKVDGNTLFEAASLSKPLYALAVLKLATIGRLDLDRPLTWVMNKPWPPDPEVQKITARMVLDHTSGLPNQSEGKLSVKFEPGSRWSYSGEGYRLLQRAVRDLTGMSAGPFVEMNVMKPLGMRSSSWTTPQHPAGAIAVGHDRDGKPLPAHQWKSPDVASSLLTTASDYAGFVAASLRDRMENIPPATLDLMRATQVSVDPKLGIYWGLGWALQRTDVGNVFFHWGSNPGFKSFALGDPANKDGIVILTNGDNGLEIAEAITKAVLGRTYPLFHFRMMHPTD